MDADQGRNRVIAKKAAEQAEEMTKERGQLQGSRISLIIRLTETGFMASGGGTREGVLAAIRKAAAELGRPPSRKELQRLTGVSHFKVLKHFRTLREAVRAAGLEPSRKGQRITTRELLEDWGRVMHKLGNPPTRSEYVRDGKYSTGAFYQRFGSWRAVEEKFYREENRRRSRDQDGDSTAKDARGAKESREGRESTGSRDRLTRSTGMKNLPQMSADERRSGTGDREVNENRHEGDKALAMEWAGALQKLPASLEGKRRVTEVVCAMIVNTLMGAEAGQRWQMAMASSTQQSAVSIQPQSGKERGEEFRGLAAEATVLRGGPRPRWMVNGERVGGVMDRGRPVMGEPFDCSALTNAPINELGVVFLFGMLAGELGFQVESLRAGYPDCEAKRQVRPGKWQRERIEFEFESRNFALHGHDPEKCDVIVCWRHNWAGCPERIEVVELSKVLGR